MQKELYKLYSVLVQVVRVWYSEFSVVNPHDFIEALAWSDSVGARDTQIVRRLREQTSTPNGIRKKLFIPFSLDADIFVAVVDLGAAAFQILDRRTPEDLQTRETDDGFETSTFVWEFMRTLFPDECPRLTAWTILFERTVQGPMAIGDQGIVSGRYVSEFGRNLKLGSILPYFFEALRIVCGVSSKKRADDAALLKRLFALFEGSPDLKTTDVIQKLRQDSETMFKGSLEGRVVRAVDRGNEAVRAAVVRTIERSRGYCTPAELIREKIRARGGIFQAVGHSYNAVGDLMAQYAQIRLLVEGMASKCLMTKSGLHHAMLHGMATAWLHTPSVRNDILAPEAALNQFRSQGLNALGQRLQDMKAELDHWVGMLHERVDSTKITMR